MLYNSKLLLSNGCSILSVRCPILMFPIEGWKRKKIHVEVRRNKFVYRANKAYRIILQNKMSSTLIVNTNLTEIAQFSSTSSDTTNFAKAFSVIDYEILI